MMRATSLLASSIALVTAALLVACDDAPRPPARVSPLPAVVRQLEIRGPDSIPPAQSAQFIAIAHQSDGSTRDVTAEVRWSSNASAIVSISATGQATAVERGEAGIVARLQGISASIAVMVVPPGTYRLTGTVREAGTELVGARVQATGPDGALETTTGSGGRYALYGVAGETVLRVTKDGYRERIERSVITQHQSLDIELTPSRPRADLSGTYTLTMTAAPSCADVLPQEHRSRTYPAVVTQTGPAVNVILEGANFAVDREGRGSRFSGLLDPSSAMATFRLQFWEGFYYFGVIDVHPDVIERIAASQYLVISGVADVRVSSTRLSASLKGSIEIIESVDLISFKRIAQCSSNDHVFSLSR